MIYHLWPNKRAAWNNRARVMGILQPNLAAAGKKTAVDNAKYLNAQVVSTIALSSKVQVLTYIYRTKVF